VFLEIDINPLFEFPYEELPPFPLPDPEFPFGYPPPVFLSWLPKNHPDIPDEFILLDEFCPP
jgi:hypothetical protein